MPHRSPRALLGACALFVCSPLALAQELPSSFYVEELISPGARITEFHIDERGTVWYALKTGQIHTYDAQGTQSTTPIVDIGEEVANFLDHGLQSFVLDPDFDDNGYIYLYYIVDWHHAQFFGTPNYDPLVDEYFHDTVGRVARYTVLDPDDPLSLADPASRLVLLGESIDDGIPICSGSHGLGTIQFGLDGSLLLSAGDAWTLGSLTSDSCFEDGIIGPKEDVLFYTAQLPDSPNGKLMRLDPATGAGLPDNPFYDPLEPMAPRSRVYALGLRNPYGFDVRPDDDHDHNHGDHDSGPGSIYIGDVGPHNWEELNVCTEAGQNFGWPAFLGMDTDVYFTFQLHENLDAPNPLFGQWIPGVGQCGSPYFLFQDLILQDTLNAPFWPNPCDPAQAIPSSIPTFVHRRPAVAWAHHDEFPEPTAYVPTYGPGGEATTALLGTSGSPVVGDSFSGNCSVGGHWFRGEGFPSIYEDVFFFADYGERWLSVMRFDENDQLQSVEPFGSEFIAILAMRSQDGVDGLYYLDYLGPGGTSSIKRILFSGNNPPSAVIAADTQSGDSPLRVQFSAAGSSDPEGDPVTLAWDFGDGTPASPVDAFQEAWHVYPSEDISNQGHIISILDWLSPPTPMGTGSQDPAVIVDGVYPPQGSDQPSAQFDTAHYDGQGQPDKGNLDYTGMTLTQPRELVGLTWQQGQVFGDQGGWLEAVRVQVRDPDTGVWSYVPGTVTPPYVAPGASFQTYQIAIDPVVADAIRIGGPPGGTDQFMSTAELRVFASPLVPQGAQAFTASLTVTDTFGGQDVDNYLVTVDNHPPVVSITSPAQGQTYVAGQAFDLPLTALVSDPDQSLAELSCVWDVSLIHDNHQHPEPLVSSCDGTVTINPHGELLGDSVYWRATLRVTDPFGLTTEATHWLLPAQDCDLSGTDDALEIAQGLLVDADRNGVPDVCELDCNANGLNDAAELVIGTGTDLNASGRLDQCEPVLADPSPGTLDAVNTLDMSGGVPNTLYIVLAGTQPGAVPLPTCTGLQSISVGIADWFVLGVNATDGNGDSSFGLFLPSGIFLLQAWFQNVAPSACEVSSMAQFTWPSAG